MGKDQQDRETLVRVPANPYWKLFKHIEERDLPSTGEIARALDWPIQLVRSRLRALAKAGFVKADGYEFPPRPGAGAERTWVARNAYSAAMYEKRFPAPQGFGKT